MTISYIRRPRHRSYSEGSASNSARFSAVVRRAGLELGDGRGRRLARLGVLEHGAPVGHAHRVEPAQKVAPALMEDGVTNLHRRSTETSIRPILSAATSLSRVRYAMGDRGFEPRTSALSERRSNQLS